MSDEGRRYVYIFYSWMCCQSLSQRRAEHCWMVQPFTDASIQQHSSQHWSTSQFCPFFFLPKNNRYSNFWSTQVPYYTVFHQFHTAVRGPITSCLMSCPKPVRGPEFQLSESHPTEPSWQWQQSVSVPAPLNANELHLSTPTWRSLPVTSHKGGEAPCVSSSMR